MNFCHKNLKKKKNSMSTQCHKNSMYSLRQSVTLTNENYGKALTILKER